MWVKWGEFFGKVVSIHYRPPVTSREEMWVLLVAGVKTGDPTVRLYSLDYNDIDEVIDPPTEPPVIVDWQAHLPV